MTRLDSNRRYSEELGYVTIPERDCPDTGEYETECECAYHTAHPAR